MTQAGVGDAFDFDASVQTYRGGARKHCEGTTKLVGSLGGRPLLGTRIVSDGVHEWKMRLTMRTGRNPYYLLGVAECGKQDVEADMRNAGQRVRARRVAPRACCALHALAARAPGFA